MWAAPVLRLRRARPHNTPGPGTAIDLKFSVVVAGSFQPTDVRKMRSPFCQSHQIVQVPAYPRSNMLVLISGITVMRSNINPNLTKVIRRFYII